MRILTIALFIFSFGQVHAQELRASIKVLSQEVQTTNKDIFTSLESALDNFLNGYAFTEYTYANEERIECSFVLTVKSLNGNKFDATLQVQYSRPIYGSNYNSPILKVLDNDVVFSYAENEPIDFQKQTYTTNLSSILAFYAYTIIGMDRASMKNGAGKEEFAIAQQIVTTAQSSGGASGWKSFDGNKNRFWIADNLNSPAFEPVLTCIYNYHRLGLDQMHKEEAQKLALEVITKSLNLLVEPNNKRPNSYLMNLFFDAKYQEIISLYSESNSLGVDITGLQATLETLDRTHASSYSKLGK